MAILQYTLEEAYSGNTQINMYKDGELVNSVIESDWALSGYLNCLEDEGYEKAYDVRTYKKAWEEAIEAEKITRDAYNRALENPIYAKEDNN